MSSAIDSAKEAVSKAMHFIESNVGKLAADVVQQLTKQIGKVQDLITEAESASGVEEAEVLVERAGETAELGVELAGAAAVIAV